MGRFTPGTFTNYITRSFREPRLIICTDPRADHQAIKEASYVNIPVIAFADTDAPLNFVDVAIPTNNKGKHAIGTVYWFLARAVLRLRGTLEYDTPWDVMVDMFFYRDPEEAEKEAAAAAGLEGKEEGGDWNPAGVEADWAIEGAAAEGAAGVAPPAGEWSAQAAADWAEDAGGSSSWADAAPTTGGGSSWD